MRDTSGLARERDGPVVFGHGKVFPALKIVAPENPVPHARNRF
jgi:hypothetical protein